MAEPKHSLGSEAKADLEELLTYIQRRDGMLRAEAVALKIDRALASLAYMPNVGRRINRSGWPLRYNIRPWLVLFEPSESGINVLRIYDGRRDLRKLFREYRESKGKRG